MALCTDLRHQTKIQRVHVSLRRPADNPSRYSCRTQRRYYVPIQRVWSEMGGGMMEKAQHRLLPQMPLPIFKRTLLTCCCALAFSQVAIRGPIRSVAYLRDISYMPNMPSRGCGLKITARWLCGVGIRSYQIRQQTHVRSHASSLKRHCSHNITRFPTPPNGYITADFRCESQALESLGSKTAGCE